MTFTDEVLTIRVAGARTRFLDEVTSALKEAASRSIETEAPSKADIEAELRLQIGHGRRLLAMAESACNDLPAYVKLQPTIHKVLTEALAEAAKHFQGLQTMAVDWRRRQVEMFDGTKEFAPLINKLDDVRAHLIAAWHDVFPGLELDKVSQAIQDLDAGKGRPLDTVLAEFAGKSR
jgi:hypothetical protein